MKRMMFLLCASLLFTGNTIFAADPTLPELFKRAKDKFASADYRGSLADLIGRRSSHSWDRQPTSA
jgi:hypothetical protein